MQQIQSRSPHTNGVRALSGLDRCPWLVTSHRSLPSRSDRPRPVRGEIPELGRPMPNRPLPTVAHLLECQALGIAMEDAPQPQSHPSDD